MSSDDPPSFADLDVAVAHWRTTESGGSVRVAAAIADTLGCDTVYTVGQPPADIRERVDVGFHDVLSDLSLSPLRRLQASLGRPFEYALWEDVDWRAYGHPDVLVTSGSITRAVVTPDDTLHVHYCHSPPRWLYDLYHERKQSPMGLLARPALRYLRLVDAAIDDRVDHYLANSPVVQRRIWKYYGRNSTLLYPPLSLGDYADRESEGFYLHLGRLDDEKGVEAVVDAFDGTDRQLVLAGGRGDAPGALLERIRAAENISYRGFVDEEEKRRLLSTCRAVVFNGQNEDFGIVPVEANASARASLVPDEGYPGMFVDEGENGYTHDGTAAGIGDALERFEAEPVSPDPARVEQFSRGQFEEQLVGYLTDRYAAFTERFEV